MSIWHRRIEPKICVLLRVRPKIVTYFSYLIMRIEHEGMDATLVSCIDNSNNGLRIPKSLSLSLCFFLRHVIDTEELVIAKNDLVHI